MKPGDRVILRSDLTLTDFYAVGLSGKTFSYYMKNKNESYTINYIYEDDIHGVYVNININGLCLSFFKSYFKCGRLYKLKRILR